MCYDYDDVLIPNRMLEEQLFLLFLLLTVFQFSCQDHAEVDPEICLQVNENRPLLVKVYGEKGREMFNRYCPPHDADYYKSN